MSGSFGVVFAEEDSEIEKWNNELIMIKQKIEASEQQLIPLTLQERQEQMDRAWDALYNLNVAKGNVVHIGHIYTEDTISKYTSRDASNRIMIQNGDIILIKPKYWNVWWAPIVG